ncbi:MAG: hypothetical protein V4667_01875 [Bacteroidota bacterium]
MINELIILNCGHSSDSGLLIAIIPAIILAIWNFVLNKKIEEVKSEGQKEIHVHKIQFEKEFVIYESVWQKIIELKEASFHLRPKFSFRDKEKTYEEQTNENVQKVVAVGNELISLTEKNKPFYDQQVYNELSKIIILIRSEIIEVQYGDRKKAEYWDNGKETLDKLIVSADLICETIRKRIRNINANANNQI